MCADQEIQTISIEAAAGSNVSTIYFLCGRLVYLIDRYGELNRKLLNITYEVSGVARDVPGILGLKEIPTEIGFSKKTYTPVDWDDALSNVTELVVHRDMIDDPALMEDIMRLVIFICAAYSRSLTDPVTTLWGYNVP